MAITARGTEIPDSDDEPFTSSPNAPADGLHTSQLDGTAEDHSSHADVTKHAPFTVKLPKGAQQVASADLLSPGDDALAGPASQALAPDAGRTTISHRHDQPFTDACNSSNEQSEEPTEPSSLIVHGLQEQPSETASSGGKEPITSTYENVCESPVETPNETSSVSCANDHVPSTDGKPGNKHLAPADSSIAPITLAVQDDRPVAQNAERHSIARSARHTQNDLLESPQLNWFATGIDPASNSVSPDNASERSSSCPPSPLKRDMLLRSSGGLSPRRSITTEQKPQSEELSKNESSRMSTLIEGKSDQRPKPDVGGLTVPACNIATDHSDQTESRNAEQDKEVERSVSANQSADPDLSDAREMAATKAKVRNECTEGHKPLDLSPVAPAYNTPNTKPPPHPLTSTPSSAAAAAPTATLHTPPAKSKTAQEITLQELKAQRAALLASLASLPAIQTLLAEARAPNPTPSPSPSPSASLQATDAEPTDTEILAAAHRLNKKHIKLLHEYNEIKDVGQGLMGLIADQRGVRIVEVQDDFGIDAND